MASGATWEELLGSNEWKGLIDPLDLNLKKLILQCGDMCDATYDAFIGDSNSKYCGAGRYGMKSFFKNVFLADCASKYQVVSFIYSTPIDVPTNDSSFNVGSNLFYHTNWMGYIAVSNDEFSKANGRREIYVVWRGTILLTELIDDLNTNLVSALPIMGPHPVNLIPGSDAAGGAKVMEGWLSIYTANNPQSQFTKHSAQTQILTKIKELAEQYKGENLSLIFTGHSLGGVLAALSAYNVADTGAVPSNVPVSAFVFCCPTLGNQVLCDKIKARKNLRILHMKNVKDFLANYPKSVFPWGDYAHPGIELEVDTSKSPYLNPSQSLISMDNRLNWHNLQGLLHVVAGWNGSKGEFKLNVKRSLALVNKSSGFLKDEYRIPKSWSVERNKRMALDQNGEWVEKEPFQED
ncbi:phospholipase A1-IIdelta-like [Cornus florida]|uniref:phospholipase A1-IIdelta-like n=1 Tax=Cornus florida TaxID=4283 RepID=UPI002896A2F1|nr:phospholipase A1-IIdelta-like [Cornus florida]